MRERGIIIKVPVSEKEKAMITAKMKSMGIKNRSAFIRKMVLEGICINLEIPELKEVLRLMRYTSNNMNQYAKRANETDSICREDIKNLQKKLDEIWQLLREILSELARIY